MKTPQILRRAAQIIERRGWTRGKYGEHDGPVCITTAIYSVVGSAPCRTHAGAAGAEMAVEDLIGDPRGLRSPSTVTMNDKQVVSQDHAVTLLCMAAAVAERP